MNDRSLDGATSRFLYFLSSQNDNWRQSASRDTHIGVNEIRMRESSKAPFDDERARQVAHSWGFELVDKIKTSGRYYWKVRRMDAPSADIIGGPKRELVRANPAAQAEAKRVLQETGVNVLDPEECYRIEEEASKQLASAVGGAWGVSCLGSLTMVFGGFGALFFSTFAVSIPLLVLAAASLAGMIRSNISRARNKREFKEKHLANAEAIRRVVRVAEEELRAGWRPTPNESLS
ncbi:hypothetical protein [Streptomyces marispadix]|uniref:Uncharacterized protein n=1 Tax=Streptomyces marispadix TaxID=2922868 RepID=A0ABS9T3Y2_9ACTN|nr:hypothetical protein [Streptomyces marispadix]MCH6163244.1 hypothetical protein [Streptomyces marispadix]